MKYKSNRKEVQKAMDNAQERMMLALGKGAEGFVKLDTPVDTGALRDSIDSKSDKKSVYVGSTLTSEDYPIIVEKGSSTQPAQSYIHSGIMGNLTQLKAIAERTYNL